MIWRQPEKTLGRPRTESIVAAAVQWGSKPPRTIAVCPATDAKVLFARSASVRFKLPDSKTALGDFSS